MNALTLSAPRRRRQVVILNSIAPKGPTAQPLTVSAKAMSLLVMWLAAICAVAAIVGFVIESDILAASASALGGICIFFVEPAISKGGSHE